MPSRFNKFLRLVMAISSLIVIILIISYPKQSLTAALRGLHTWINVVLPALLPFFIVSDIMIQTGIVDFLSTLLNPIMKPLFNCPGNSSFVWVMSITSGYPMGPKLIASLYQDGSITRAEGQRMLAFCNTSGPLFMIGAVGIGMLSSPQAGKIIALSHYSAALVIGLLFRFYGRDEQNSRIPITKPSIGSAFNQLLNSNADNNKSLGTILGDSVRSSMQAQLLIGGFIILFSVIINLLVQNGAIQGNNISHNWAFIFSYGSQLFKPIASGIMEITTGCQMLSDTMLSLETKLIAASFIVGWGGFSIHSQAISLLANTDLSISLYFFAKLLHGVLSALITYVIILLSPVTTVPAFSGSGSLQYPYITNTFIASAQLLASAILSILAVMLLSILIRTITSKGD